MKRTRSLLIILLAAVLAVLLSSCISITVTEAETAHEAAEEPAEAQEPEPAPSEDKPEKPDYAAGLFDHSYVHTAEIWLSAEDWEDLLNNPTEKTKYDATITLDGEDAGEIYIATKGHSSLFFVAAMGDSTRYSFKITFGGNDKKKTFHGLRKLNLNNSFADATFVKDYLCYWLFEKMGVAAPRASFVWVIVNGEPQGLYTAVDEVNGKFLKRVFGDDGPLYEPEHESMNAELIDEMKNGASAHSEDIPEGADLVYIDDDPAHYPDIFDNAETDDDEETQALVIRALKALNEREDLESYVDTEAVIRYFAVHNYLVNFDSYTGPMLHNFYLYVRNGRLSLIPWDYNLAFGTFSPDGVVTNWTEGWRAVNQGIDSPLSGTPATEEDRPMWSWIVADEKYRAEYHDALDEMISEYFETGEMAGELDRVYDMIYMFVEHDPTSFFTLSEFETAYGTLREVVLRRAESIRKQLDGGLATVTEEQREEDRIDASDIDISTMGSPAE